MRAGAWESFQTDKSAVDARPSVPRTRGNPARTAVDSLAVTRWAPMLLVAFLLAGTAVAFAVTQGLKEERSPIYGVRFSRVFGPHRPAVLRFRLRKRDTITLTIVDADGKAVRTFRAQKHPHGLVTVYWGGRSTTALAPGGPYRLHVHLKRSDATIEIPTVFRLDTTPPALAPLSVSPPLLTRGR